MFLRSAADEVARGQGTHSRGMLELTRGTVRHSSGHGAQLNIMMVIILTEIIHYAEAGKICSAHISRVNVARSSGLLSSRIFCPTVLVMP